LSSRDEVDQVAGRCLSTEDAFTHFSSLRLDLMPVDPTLGLEASSNLVTCMSPAACCSQWRAAWSPATGRRIRRNRAGPRAERRDLTQLGQGSDNARIGQDLIHQPPHHRHSHPEHPRDARDAFQARGRHLGDAAVDPSRADSRSAGLDH
jgi:hypothetical protein